MRVLAIDTALANCAVAVCDDSAATPCLEVSSEEIGRGHAEKLMDMISEVMAESSTAFTDLDRVVVTTGPGSFTGLRVGLSVARGFGLVLGKPVVGVTTLAALACAAANDPKAGSSILVALTGKGEEVYCQTFNGHGEPAGEPAVRTLTDLRTSLPADVSFAGSAARAVAEAAGYGQERILSECGYPDIRDVARLGISADPKQAAPVPLYLRPPEASPAKSGRIERR
ncbi:tRNA (adenosine(37)-N6)-threonylcarbamoyltransferase complex dimerization subunit type 1 TsaB [uncultured Roseibium sp.]|uniref:tRNA (adenosine(37)-N6)-threonylcarbamoyltransferase complex dimerization subunit type 1 TsaB n=1 Tax=uncultured Roseibium sp. TaxID=1936171 RepID=UPI0032173ABE